MLFIRRRAEGRACPWLRALYCPCRSLCSSLSNGAFVGTLAERALNVMRHAFWSRDSHLQSQHLQRLHAIQTHYDHTHLWIVHDGVDVARDALQQHLRGTGGQGAQQVSGSGPQTVREAHTDSRTGTGSTAALTSWPALVM